jgi:HK97 family phage major capsid protein/HK97 family phage prohead protease
MRAYALLHVKGVDDGRRRFFGVCTTPTPDRNGDIVEPLGLTYQNPLTLLLHHDQHKPVGWVTLAPPTPTGITLEGELPVIAEAGVVRERVEEAWQSIKAGLLTGLSIGFRPLAKATEKLKDGGLRFLQSQIFEVSLVTIPANAEATIVAVKQLDAPHLAALGPDPSGAAERTDSASMETTQETITKWETVRANHVTRMNALMAEVQAENSALDVEQQREFDDLTASVKNIDDQVSRLRTLEQVNQASATRVTNVTTPQQASQVRGGTLPTITVKSALPKGTAFTRYCMALAASKGVRYDAIEYAKQWQSSTPEVELVLKAAVAAGTTTDATWAGPLVSIQNLAAEFLELLRPATLLGRIPGLKQVPFNVKVPAQTGGGTYGWVGEGASKPVTKLAFTSVQLGISKAAGIIVFTEELARTSTPAAEQVFRNDMIAGIAKFLDEQFIDPTVAEVAGVHPASITNGVTPIVSAGNILADIKAMMAAFQTANIGPANAVLLMSEMNAFSLAASTAAYGPQAYPNLTMGGGSVLGIPVVTSGTMADRLVLLDGPSILYADDGGVTVDVSREASVQMETAPPTPATYLVSLWQQNYVGLRAERFVNWKRARTGSVQLVTGASYTPTVVLGQAVPVEGGATTTGRSR